MSLLNKTAYIFMEKFAYKIIHKRRTKIWWTVCNSALYRFVVRRNFDIFKELTKAMAWRALHL